MKRIYQTIFLLLLSASTALADTQQASEDSIRELLAITGVRKMNESVLAQMESESQNSMNQFIAEHPNFTKHKKILEEDYRKRSDIMRNAVGWETLEPIAIEIYQRSFTEKELQGMLDFYKSDAGKAIIYKMPLVMQNYMQMMQPRIVAMQEQLDKQKENVMSQLRDNLKKQR